MTAVTLLPNAPSQATPASQLVPAPAVEVECLSVRYSDGSVVTIGGLPLRIAPGERVALLGPNGSGKSTLIRALLGLAKPAAGNVRVLGHDPYREFDRVRPHLGAVLQDVEAQLLAPTVGDDLAFGLEGRDLGRDEIRQRVLDIARAFRLEPLLDRVPHYLSGGERRKVALAGALVVEPDLLVLDEPFAGLDPRARAELVSLIREAHARRPLALLLSSHVVRELPELVDTVYVLSPERELLARDTPGRIFAQRDLLEANDIEAPPLAALRAALSRRGLTLPDSDDPDTLAAALITHLHHPNGHPAA